MSVEQNKAVIRQLFDAWNSRLPEAFDDLITPDVVRHATNRRVSRPGALTRSRNFDAGYSDFPDSVQTIKLLIAEGNRVAAWVTYKGTQQGTNGSTATFGSQGTI